MTDQVTHYKGSRGLMEIASMPHSYLLNAHDKLVRDGDPERAAEVAAMRAQIIANDTAFAEAEAVKEAAQ